MNRQQANYPSPHVGPNVCRQMASLGHGVLNMRYFFNNLLHEFSVCVQFEIYIYIVCILTIACLGNVLGNDGVHTKIHCAFITQILNVIVTEHVLEHSRNSTGGFPSQRSSNAEIILMPIHLHEWKLKGKTLLRYLNMSFRQVTWCVAELFLL